MSKLLCLKWNNHMSNLLEFFDSLLSSDAFADVTIACEGLSLKAHKIVLSACSPFFKNLFLENPSKHPIVIMKDIRFCDLKAVIKFIYSGEVSVSHDQLLSFLLTAETLKVKGLEKITAENRHALGIGKEKNVKQSTLSTPTSPPPTQTSKNTIRTSSQTKSKRACLRKRPLTNSSCSDKDGNGAKMKERVSPDMEELFDDEVPDITSDIRSGSGPSSLFMVSLHSLDDVKKSTKSRSSIPKAPKVVDDAIVSEVEPSNLLEQTLTIENASPVKKNSTGHMPLSSVSDFDISRELLRSTDASQTILPTLDVNSQAPNSPPDIKPEITTCDTLPMSPVAGSSCNIARSMIFMEQSNNSLKSLSSNSKVSVPNKQSTKKRFGKRKKQSEELLFDTTVKKEPWKQILHMCSDCSYTNGNIEELISHIEYHQKSAIQCEYCKVDFTELSSSEHLPVDDEHAVECDICNHCFCSKMALLTHKLLHHY